MADRYAVFGHPVTHSKSPLIHAEFARQTGQALVYEAIDAPLDGFPAAVAAFRAAGGRGGNVTVPFKFEAYALADERSERAEAARAVNTLTFADGRIRGDNTDGVGLVRDISVNLGVGIEGKRVLMVGAGGAAFGVLKPLLDAAPARLVIANRTLVKAEEAADILSRIPARAGQRPNTLVEVTAKRFEALPGESFDIVINATSAGLKGESLPLPAGLFAPDALAYDMMYGRETPFMAFAREQGARVADGLGMLVEQAAESFHVWRGVRPDTAPVIRLLREA